MEAGRKRQSSWQATSFDDDSDLYRPIDWFLRKAISATDSAADESRTTCGRGGMVKGIWAVAVVCRSNADLSAEYREQRRPSFIDQRWAFSQDAAAGHNQRIDTRTWCQQARHMSRCASSATNETTSRNVENLALTQWSEVRGERRWNQSNTGASAICTTMRSCNSCWRLEVTKEERST